MNENPTKYVKMIFYALLAGALFLFAIVDKLTDEECLSVGEGIIIGGLGFIFTALTLNEWSTTKSLFEKINTIVAKQSAFENKIDALHKTIDDSSVFSVIIGHKNIGYAVDKDVKNARYYIRATAFGTEQKESITGEYYQLLAQQIKAESTLRYITAYHNLKSLKARKAALKKILSKEHFNRVIHYKFDHEQFYLNVLLIDGKVAYIGFPKDKYDIQMQFVLRISSNSSEGEDLIKNLERWYDDFIVAKGTKEDSYELLTK